MTGLKKLNQEQINLIILVINSSKVWLMIWQFFSKQVKWSKPVQVTCCENIVSS